MCCKRQHIVHTHAHNAIQCNQIVRQLQTQYYLIPIMSNTTRAIAIKQTNKHSHTMSWKRGRERGARETEREREREWKKAEVKSYLRILLHLAAVVRFLFVYLMVIRFSKLHLYLKPHFNCVAAQIHTHTQTHTHIDLEFSLAHLP